MLPARGEKLESAEVVVTDDHRRYRQAAIAFLAYIPLGLVSLALIPAGRVEKSPPATVMAIYAIAAIALTLIAPLIAQGYRWPLCAWLTRLLSIVIIVHAFYLTRYFPRAVALVPVSLGMLAAAVFLARASWDVIWLRQHL
jgi:heme/copper-type cytochrome/quinol oxidase subunit 4